MQHAIEAAAEILTRADLPLVYGLGNSTTESQRAAIMLAEEIGGIVDRHTSLTHGPSKIAAQLVGKVTCTLGEVKNRADLVIYWGTNPVETHPRHLTKYTFTSRGRHVTRGRHDRTMLVVDVRETTSARASDRFFQIRPGVDFELLTVLRVLVNGQPFDQGLVDRSGVQLTDLAELAGRMKRARLGVLDRSRGYPRRTAWLHFTAASPGIHAAGTAYRMDKVPLPMRSVLRSAHATDEDILHGIRHALTPSRARQMKISPLPGTLASPV